MIFPGRPIGASATASAAHDRSGHAGELRDRDARAQQLPDVRGAGGIGQVPEVTIEAHGEARVPIKGVGDQLHAAEYRKVTAR